MSAVPIRLSPLDREPAASSSTEPGPAQRVAIVLLNWNNTSDTVACVQSLGRLSYRNFKIVIVDNHSRPEVFRALQSELPSEVILRQKRNLGFAGGCNAGIRWALRNGFDYVWLLNNDAVVAPETLAELLLAAESDPRIGMAGGLVYYYNDPERIQMAGGRVDPVSGQGRMLGQDEWDQGQFRGINEVEYVSGAMLLIKRAALAQVGLLDERFFMYYEDTDWGVRMRASGWRVVTAAAAKCWHKDKSSAGTRKPYLIQHGYFMFLYKNSRRRLPQALRLYARHQLRPHLTRREWRLAWADVKVYLKFFARLAFVRANLQA
jgi:GT2 family glycosyltransferase